MRREILVGCVMMAAAAAGCSFQTSGSMFGRSGSTSPAAGSAARTAPATATGSAAAPAPAAAAATATAAAPAAGAVPAAPATRPDRAGPIEPGYGDPPAGPPWNDRPASKSEWGVSNPGGRVNDKPYDCDLYDQCLHPSSWLVEHEHGDSVLVVFELDGVFYVFYTPTGRGQEPVTQGTAHRTRRLQPHELKPGMRVFVYGDRSYLKPRSWQWATYHWNVGTIASIDTTNDTFTLEGHELEFWTNQARVSVESRPLSK